MTEPHVNGVPLAQHIDRVLAEKQAALDTAAIEREKAAAALRDQQYRAMEQAEREREKAAAAMRDGLDRAIREGDERLREHIANQIQQIQGALASAEKLEKQRLEAALAATEGVRREMTLITESAKQAILKAESAQKDVNAKNNEFREQLADQASLFFPRQEAESRNNELDRRIEEARHERETRLQSQDERIRALERGESGVQGQKVGSASTIGFIVAGVGIFIAVVSVLANVVTAG